MADSHASARRESACPVHFIWDGQGRGRTLVRLGFMMFVALGMVATALPLLKIRDAGGVVWWGVLAAGLVYGAGQVLSLVDGRRRRRLQL